MGQQGRQQIGQRIGRGARRSSDGGGAPGVFPRADITPPAGSWQPLPFRVQRPDPGNAPGPPGSGDR